MTVAHEEIISGKSLSTVTPLWDHKVDYIQDATPDERFARLEKRWKQLKRGQQRWKHGWEHYLAVHSLYHYAMLAHCRSKYQKRYYSQGHWEMYLHYEMMLPLLKLRFTDAFEDPGMARMVKRFYFGPRGLGKSIGLRIALMWIKYHDPSLRTLYGKATREDAEICIAWMLTQYESNPFIRKVFPDFAVTEDDQKPKPWSKRALMLPDATGANTNRPSPEATFTAGGVDKGATGQHYDIFAPDDYVTQKNAYTSVGRNRVIEVMQEMMSVMGPEGIWIGCGTHWDQEDAYAFLRGQYNPDGEEDGVSIITAKAVRATTEGNAEGDSLFPSVLPIPHLKMMYSKIGPQKYSCLYDNDPSAKTNTTFDMAHTRYFQIRHLYAMKCKFPIHIFFDGSGDTNMSSDKSAIVVLALDYRKPPQAFILQCFNGRFVDSKIFTIFKQLYDYYNSEQMSGFVQSVNFWMQKVTFEGKYRKLIQSNVQIERPGFHIQTLDRSTRIPKWEEIASLEPMHQAGHLYYRVRDDVDFAGLPVDQPDKMVRQVTRDLRPLFREQRNHLRNKRNQDDNCIDATAQCTKVLNRRAHRIFDKKLELTTPESRILRENQMRRAIHLDFDTRMRNGEYGDIGATEACHAYADEVGIEYDDDAKIRMVS